MALIDWSSSSSSAWVYYEPKKVYEPKEVEGLAMKPKVFEYVVVSEGKAVLRAELVAENRDQALLLVPDLRALNLDLEDVDILMREFKDAGSI